MNRNNLLGILLIGAILIVYSIITSPSKEELERQKHIKDSVEKAKNVSDSLQAIKLKETKAITESKDTINKADTTKKTKKTTAFWGNQPLQSETKDIIVETDLQKITISPLGGKIKCVELKQFKTFDQKPLLLFDGDSTRFGLKFMANNRPVSTNNLYFQYIPENNTSNNLLKIGETDSATVTMRLISNDTTATQNAFVEYKYTFYGNNHMHKLQVSFHGMNSILQDNTNLVYLDWMTDMRRQEKALANERQFSTIYYKYKGDDVDYISETKDDKENLKTTLSWISFKQRFFASTLVSNGSFKNAEIETLTPESDSVVKRTSALITMQIPEGNAPSLDLQIYYGPVKYSTLRKYKMDLEQQIPLGWSFFLMHWINRYAVLPVFNFLEGFNINYGIIILILTILLKIVLFPIAYKTYKSSAKMRVLKPEIEEIGKKFPKKEDALKKQQATMALYKKAGVNPMSGCIPMLLQFPILIALFRFFPASIELRQKAFLWADDLSSYDSILSLPFNIPFYGDHVSLFTILMTISTIIYTKLNEQMMSSNQQIPGMKVMMYMMPVMFLFIFNSYSSGLSYYYFLANIITFGQMFLFRRFIDEKKLRLQIEENQKKPVKKSSFQKRLEEMQKRRTEVNSKNTRKK